MGLTFKENCPDLRNTRVVDVIAELQSYGVEVDVYDPWADAGEAWHEYGLKLLEKLPASTYDGVVLAVAHDVFREQGQGIILSSTKVAHVVYDLKNVLPREARALRL